MAAPVCHSPPGALEHHAKTFRLATQKPSMNTDDLLILAQECLRNGEKTTRAEI